MLRPSEALARVRAQKGTALSEAVEAALAKRPRLGRKLMALVMRHVARSPKLRNRGFVLDGYPRSYQEAALCFAADQEEDDLAAAADNDNEDDDEDETSAVAAAAVPGTSKGASAAAAAAAADAPEPEEEEEEEMEVSQLVTPLAAVVLDAEDTFLQAKVGVSMCHDTPRHWHLLLARARRAKARPLSDAWRSTAPRTALRACVQRAHFWSATPSWSCSCVA